ncbi:MAG: hypothetical protein IPF69_13290 [Chitinophagaceae bacterium]|nr:hypothetical protein [Chitinophagaceae bacterium]
MIEQKVTVNFFLDKSRPNAENKCLIKLNIYCKPTKKRYATSYHVTTDEWEKLNGSNLRDENLKEIRKKLNTLQSSVEKTVEKINPFSFVAFEEIYFNKVAAKPTKTTTLQSWFDAYINELHEKGRVGTAIAYRTTINSLNLYKKDCTCRMLPGFVRRL